MTTGAGGEPAGALVVRVPVRIALEAEDGDLATAPVALEALGTAVGRVLERASTQALVAGAVSRGRVRVEVDVRLRGSGAHPDAAERLRTGTEAAVRARAAGLVQPQGPPRAPGAERRHRSREGEAAGAAAPAGAASRRARPAVAPSAPRTPGRAVRLLRVHQPGDLQRALLARSGGDLTRLPRQVLVLCADPGGAPHALVVEVRQAGVEVTSRHLLGAQVATGAGGPVTWAPVEVVADELRFLAEGRTPEERRAVIRRELVAEGLEEAAVAEYLRRFPDIGRPVRFYHLLGGGSVIRVFVIAAELGIGDLPVITLTEDIAEEEVAPPPPCRSLWDLPEDPAGDLSAGYWGEPSIDAWPPSTAAALRSRMAAVATATGVSAGDHPGGLVLAALGRLRREAEALGAVAGAGGHAVRERRLQSLAASFAPVTELERTYRDLLFAASAAGVLPCPLRDQLPRWALRFLQRYSAARDAAVVGLFAAACQHIVLAVLESSAIEIARRQNHFAAYMRVTRKLLPLLLADVTELQGLRRTLLEATGPSTTELALGAALPPVAAWRAASRLVTAARDASGPVDGPVRPGRVLLTGGEPRVQDARGRWWTRAGLDAAIGGGLRLARDVDPLLERLTEAPEVLRRLREATAEGDAAVDAVFSRLLADLAQENATRTRQVRHDADIAVGLATVGEETGSGDAFGGHLRGVHAQADALLRPAFGGDPSYEAGMRGFVATERGLQALTMVGGLLGLTALAIVCPPAAFLVGGAQAIHGLDTALEHRGIQRAMLGGDEIISAAEAEMELWAAAIGAALAFLPEAGTIVRALSGGGRALARGGVQGLGTAAVRAAGSRVSAHVAGLAARQLEQVFVRDCLVGVVLDRALGAAVGRFTAAVGAESRVGGASLDEIPRLIADAVRGVQ